MKEKKDLLEQMIKEEFARLAREEEGAVPEDIHMPESVKDGLYAKIRKEIEKASEEEAREEEGEIQFALLSEEEEMELEKKLAEEDLFAQLSSEDRRALELGRRMMEEEVRREFEEKEKKRKKRMQAYIGLAASLVLALIIGVNSMGGAERIMRIMTQKVGDRRVEKITSGNKVKVSAEVSEEEAYEKLRDLLGVDPVRIIERPENMRFVQMELDEENHVAEINYEYNNQILIYLINASYNDGSWGVDVEEKTIKKETKKIHNCEFELKEYEKTEEGGEKYSAQFQYKGLAYFFVGAMERDVFEEIINNLYFY